jgi:uncharacterized damage-inducible protein DinB
MEAMMQDTERSDTNVLTTMFAHNVWANLKLLDFCEKLSDEQLDTTAIGCFGSIRNTLVHIVGAEVSYVVRVNGKLPPQPFSRGEFPGFAVLKDVARWTNEELLQLALSTREDTMVRESGKGWSAEYRLASLIMQTINHATEHRAQISAIITQMGMEPPDMSGWQYVVDIGEFQETNEETDGA